MEAHKISPVGYLFIIEIVLLQILIVTPFILRICGVGWTFGLDLKWGISIFILVVMIIITGIIWIVSIMVSTLAKKR